MKSGIWDKGPPAHVSPFGRIGWTQRRFGIGVVQIFADDRRLDDHVAVVDQRRHDTLRIELEIFGGVGIAASQIEVMLLRLQPLFRQDNPHLLGADRHVVVIEFHRFFPDRISRNPG
jgi:hypothetical protein